MYKADELKTHTSSDAAANADRAVAPPRPSLRSDACVWNSTKKQPPLNNSNDNDEAAANDGRPSFQSNAGTCGTNKCTNDNNRSSEQNDITTAVGEPWRNYGKSYARHSARNPANYYSTNAAAATTKNNNDDDKTADNNDCETTAVAEEEEEGAPLSTKKKTTPPPSSSTKKKKTHQLMRRLQQHSTKLQHHHHNSSSSSQSSSTRNDDDDNDDDDHQNNDNDDNNLQQQPPVVNNNDNPTSPGRPTYNNQPIYTTSHLPSGTTNNSPMGQEIEIVDRSMEDNNNEEEEYEFSPLTCPPSQPNFYGGGLNNDEDKDEDDSDEEEEEGGEEKEEEEEGNANYKQKEGAEAEANDEGEQQGSGQLKNDADYESSSSTGKEEEAASDHPTLVKNYTAALKASTTATTTTAVNHHIKSSNATATEKRGTKRKPTALDLALIEESTKNATAVVVVAAAAEANNNNTGSGRNRRKFNAIAAALAEKEDSQTPPYDVPTPRNAEEEKVEVEGKNEEDGVDNEKEESMGNNEGNFSFPSQDGDDDNEEETGTEEKQSEALLSSPSEKQSEALLSSPSIQPKEVATATTVVETAAAAAKTREEATDKLVANLQAITSNLGKALTCPICQASLREAQILPCCHAFCKSCLAQTFNPARSGNKEKKKKGSSPPQTAFKQCPTCKNPADRRSVVPIPQLDDQVKAYKQILREFGLAPVKHTEGMAMTQLDPEDNDDVLDAEEIRQCLQASETVSASTARKKAKATATATATIQKPSELPRKTRSQPQQQQRLTKEQMESQHEIRRWQQATKEQENVVKVNQDAFNKVKGRAHQLVQRKMVQAETVKFLATVNEADESKVAAAVEKTAVGGTAANDGDDSSDDEVDFCTAPDGESMEYDTAKESQGLSMTITSAGQSPMVVNDGNTVKKAERSGGEDRSSSTISGSRVFDLEVSPEAQKKKAGRDSLETVGTGNASPIVLHDGNTVRKTRPGNNKDENNKSSESHEEDKTPRSSGNFLRCEGVAMKSAGDADLEEVDDDESEYGAETQPIGKPAAQKPTAASASVDEPAQRDLIVKGSVVTVQARTWPGINKHGGVGRVTKVHSSAESGGSAVQYDVSYVLGGKEKFVDESFVQLHKTSEEESSTIVASARKPRKSSEKKMECRRPKRTQQKVTFKEEVRIYNEEELKHIPAEALEWAGIVPKKGKGKKKAAAAAGKKRALADSNSNTNTAGSSTKKQKAAPAAAAAASKIASKPKNRAKSKKVKTEAQAESSGVDALMAMAHGSGTAALNEIISPLSTQEIVKCADERYSTLLSASGDSDVSLVLNVVTSNLSDEESDSLNSLCKMFKDKNGEIRIAASNCRCLLSIKFSQLHLFSISSLRA